MVVVTSAKIAVMPTSRAVISGRGRSFSAAMTIAASSQPAGLVSRRFRTFNFKHFEAQGFTLLPLLSVCENSQHPSRRDSLQGTLAAALKRKGDWHGGEWQKRSLCLLGAF